LHIQLRLELHNLSLTIFLKRSMVSPSIRLLKF